MRCLLVLAIACSSPAATPSNTVPPKHDDTAMPTEVSALLGRWESCWHFRGEEGTDAARKQEILDGQNKYCPGNDDELARLRAKYKDRSDVQTALDKTREWQ